jgi:hydroxypyruvate isomerase
MLNFSVCVEMIFRRNAQGKDVPMADRIARVAEAGAPAIEFWGWQNKNADEIIGAAKKHGLKIAAMGAGAGPLVDPAKRSEYLAALKQGIAFGHRIGCATFLQTVGQELPGMPREAQHKSIVDGLKAAAPIVQKEGITLVVEPLNILVNHKGYYLVTTAEGAEIVREVGSPNIRLLYDIYHQQISEGNVIDTIAANIAAIGHFHMGDVPGRHEPGTGELNYRNIFKKIESLGYKGHVGMEFAPICDHAKAVRDTMALAK